LIKTPVSRVIDEKLKDKFKELENLTNFDKNYRLYREKLKSIKEEEPCIPIISAITSDLQRNWERKNEKGARYLDSQVDLLQSLVKTLTFFQQFYRQCNFYNFDVINSVFFFLPLVPEDVKMEYSNWLVPWPYLKKEREKEKEKEININKEIKLSDWTFANLAAKLEEWEEANLIPIFLENYIWDGKALIEYIKTTDDDSNDPKKNNLLKLGIGENSVDNILNKIQPLLLKENL
jgi:hypothetical protein